MERFPSSRPLNPRVHTRFIHLDFTKLLLVIMLFWFYSGFEYYLGVYGTSSLRDAKWAIYAAGVPTILFICARPSILQQIPRVLIYWILCVILFSLLWAAAFPETAATVLEFKERKSALAFLCIILVLLAQDGAPLLA